MAEDTIFARRSIIEHVMCGAIGLGALSAAIAVASTYAWVSLALGVVMLIAFRGCPMCWTIGLVETVRARLRV